ncbi:hypothetical protein HCJ52_13850 [Listeria sp. FSL L7-1485]|uniref:Uncharacterized protein n=1 Tax=Listeria immobilis TaxID=2713502 RepID=A0A7X0XA22_9LIST|nr:MULTISPECIES: hypothetical protein [Listeria]MBC1481553.1 hypothetical protein [Listeria seeligeri]MBC1490138.1 hypothetical protein [Listeria immobilis]MBC1537199.1 hypothetical protein [Listeria immobilis]
MNSRRTPDMPFSRHIVCINQRKQAHESRAQIYMLVELPMNCSEMKFALGFNAWIKKEPNLQVILQTKKTRSIKPLYLRDIQEIRVMKKMNKENIYVLDLTETQQSRFIQTLLDVAN